MKQLEETAVNPYKQVLVRARQKLESSPKFRVLNKLGACEPKALSPIPFPYGKEGKTEYNFDTC